MKIFRASSFFYALVLVGILGLMWWGFGFTKRHDTANEEKSGVKMDNEKGDKIQPAPPPEETSEKPAPNSSRLELMAQAEIAAKTNLPRAVSTNPIVRFWFVTDNEYYVEYRRTGMSVADRMAFFTVKNGSVVRTALYGQNESGAWELISGTDVLIDKPQLDLYEKNAQGAWSKIN